MPKKGFILKSATDIYTVGALRGGGGAGEVYEVTSDSGNYAAKVLRRNLSSQKLKRFKNELMFGMRESHQNLVQVLDSGRTENDESFYIMPLASGTLRDLMKSEIPEDARLPLFSQVLDGVEAAHLLGVIHRDLKPENILQFGSPIRLQVADFGIAHFEEEALHTSIETRADERIGNWVYAAPEQRIVGSTIDLRADIYALGLILAELFTREVPHGLGNKKIAEVSPNYAYLDDLVDSMRQQDVSHRPASIAEVKKVLIGQRAAFVEAQKLDTLKRVVVKDSSITDPLVRNPPKLVDVNVRPEHLEFVVEPYPTADWIIVFMKMPAGGMVGYMPENHRFRNPGVNISCRLDLAQRLVDQFKGFLAQANQIYALQVEQNERARISKERAVLAAQIQQEQTIAKVRNNLKW